MGTIERVTWDGDGGSDYMGMGTVERFTRWLGWWSELHGDGYDGASYTGMGKVERVTRG